MRPILRLSAGLVASLTLLVALASCGGIEVVAGSISLNAGYDYCRYEVVANRVTKNGSSNDVWPAWLNDVPVTPVFENVKTICMLEECQGDPCRVAGTAPIPVTTNVSTEKYVVNSFPCAKQCDGYPGKW